MSAAATINMAQLNQRLADSARYAGKAMDDVMSDAAEKILESMMRRVPRRTGRLAASLSIRRLPGRIEIGPTDVPYATYVEFGTGSRGEFGGSSYEIRPKTATALKFSIGGRTYYAKSVRHPGIAPRPFVRPAAQEWLDYIGVEAGHAAAKMITGGAP